MEIGHILAHWQAVRMGLVATVDKIQDDELDYRPFPASWTVQQLMLHIAQEENGEFNFGITQTLSEFPGDYDTHAYPTVASIQGLLASVHATSIEYLKTLCEEDLDKAIHTPWGSEQSLIEMIDHLIDHEIHHRAELSLIAGMLGREGLNA